MAGQPTRVVDIKTCRNSRMRIKFNKSMAAVVLVGQCVALHLASAQDWVSNSLPGAYYNQALGRLWEQIASSSDGVKLIISTGGSSSDAIYTSTNFGMSWISNNLPIAAWGPVASSANGTTLAAAIGSSGGGLIYISTNSGSNWSPSSSAPSAYWGGLTCSADGTKLVAGTSLTSGFAPGPIYFSTNSGGTWSLAMAPLESWGAMASSADGTKLAAIANAATIYTSTDSGMTWVSNTVSSTTPWKGIASSADGSKLVAMSGNYAYGVGEGSIFTSTNSGGTWVVQTNAPNAAWNSVAVSADATKLVATTSVSPAIYTSTDSGADWTSNSLPISSFTGWYASASSADGSKQAALGQAGLFTMQAEAAESPALSTSFSSSKLIISWPTNAIGFGLQQNMTLAPGGWVGAMNPVTVVGAQNQVSVPLTNSSSFYRLKSTNP